MTGTIHTTTRSVVLSAALLLAGGLPASPGFAQTTGDAPGATGTSPSPGPGVSRGLTGSSYQGQVGETGEERTRADAAVVEERPQRIHEFTTELTRHAGTEDIVNELRDLGFTEIRDVRYSGEVFEATADWNGETVALSIDGDTGAISYEEAQVREIALPADAAIPTQANTAMDADYVREQLQEIGFTDIRDIEVSHRNARGAQIPVFETAARYDGEWVNLTIDGADGGIKVE